jgi:hypothetical protein
VGQPLVGRHLHPLGVHQHQAQVVGSPAEQSPTMQLLTKTLFPEPVVPATRRWGRILQSRHQGFPVHTHPQGQGQVRLRLLKVSTPGGSAGGWIGDGGWGSRCPRRACPGLGASTRRLGTARARARSLGEGGHAAYLHSRAGWIRNWITVGPTWVSPSSASMPNSSREETMRSPRGRMVSSPACPNRPPEGPSGLREEGSSPVPPREPGGREKASSGSSLSRSSHGDAAERIRFPEGSALSSSCVSSWRARPGENGSLGRRRRVPAFPFSPLEKACREPFEQVEQLVRQVLGGVSPKGRRRDGREEESQQGRSQGAQELRTPRAKWLPQLPACRKAAGARRPPPEGPGRGCSRGVSPRTPGTDVGGTGSPFGRVAGCPRRRKKAKGIHAAVPTDPNRRSPRSRPRSPSRGWPERRGRRGEPQKTKGKPVHRRPEGGQPLAKLEERIPFGGGRLSS